MNKINIIIIFYVFITTSFAYQAEINFTDSWDKHGISIEKQNSKELRLNYSITEFNFEEIVIYNENLTNVLLSDVFLPNNEGMPNLPGNGYFIALPNGAKAELHIIDYRIERYHDINIAPAPRIPLDTDDSPLEYSRNQNIYSKNAFYPANPVKLGEQTQMRGVDVVMLGITPFQYNPVTKELIVYRDLQVKVEFVGGNGYFGADNLRSRWWDPILSDHILNYGSLPIMDYSSNSRTRDGAEYLIICPDDATFLAWADSIKVFRTQQGISTIVMTTTEVGGNTPTAIENYIDDIMDPDTGWDPAPAAILLMGDHGTTGNTVVSPIYNNYCVSDNIYADVSGNMMPDVTLARMTAQNADQLETMVTKFLNYERNPPINPFFYDHPVTALGWQTERWFQICSEAVGGFFLHEQGKNPIRINAVYSGSPSTIWSTATNTATVVNIFGPNDLGYIPATPAELGGWTGGTTAMVNHAINSGAFLLQHRDHGSTTGWGEPDYQSSDINGLTNTDLTFVFSINCLTGKFNLGGECFAEKFHRYTYNGVNSGALGIIAASEVSYSFVNDTFVWGMYDNLWPDFLPYATIPVSRGVLPAFANSAGKYFLERSSWPYNTNNKAVTYALFHHHGDAFTTVYTEIPQDLTVSHAQTLIAGATTFTVTADDGALIALSVEGELIGVAEGTGLPVNISIPAQNGGEVILVTITKQDCYRYSSEVTVLSLIPDITINPTSFSKTLGLNAVTQQILSITNDGEIGSNLLYNILISEVTERELSKLRYSNKGAAKDQTRVSWLTINQDNGSLAQGVSDNINLTFSSSGLAVGTYNANIEVTSNDPDEAVVIIPVLLTINDNSSSGSGNNSGNTSTAAVVDMPSTNIDGIYVDPDVSVDPDGAVAITVNVTVTDEVQGSVQVPNSSNVIISYAVEVIGNIDEIELAIELSFSGLSGLTYIYWFNGISWEIPDNLVWNYGLSLVSFTATLPALRNGSTEIILGEDNPLPVTLSSFTAEYSNNHPIINWVTQSESNNSGWNIYRADSSDPDQASILNLNTIPGNVTTPEPSYYSFIDEYDVQENFTYWYWLESIAVSGEIEIFGPISLTIPLDENDIQEIPTLTVLHQNFPNPFNPNTSISFDIKENETGVLSIYNIKGQLIVSKEFEAGTHIYTWNASDQASGIYLYKLHTDSYSKMIKMLLVK